MVLLTSSCLLLGCPEVPLGSLAAPSIYSPPKGFVACHEALKISVGPLREKTGSDCVKHRLIMSRR